MRRRSMLALGRPAAALFAAIVPGFAAAAQDGCDDEDVRFLQAHHYSAREVRLYCTGGERAMPTTTAPPITEPVRPSIPAAKPEKSVSRPASSPFKSAMFAAPADGGASPPVTGNGADPKDPKPIDTTEAKTVDPLSLLNMSESNGSVLATMHIVTAYAPVRAAVNNEAKAKKEDTEKTEKPDKCANIRAGIMDRLAEGALGLDISTSMPVKSPTLPEYGRHALSKLDGGLLNVFGSWGEWTPDDPVYCPVKSGSHTNPRLTMFDHLYVGNATGPDQMVPYIKHGAGVRAVKTKLEGGGFGGVGTAYLGLGVDGPLLSSLAQTTDPRAGWFSIEAFGVANLLNHRTLESLFLPEGTQDQAPGHLYTANGRVKIDLPGRFYLSAEYAKPFGSFKGHIGDTSIVTFGYNNQSDPGKKTP